MNETPLDKKELPPAEKKAKPFAVIGFFIVIALIVVATIGIIKYLPQGFSSLASISESLDRYRSGDAPTDSTEIVLTSTTTEAIAGEPVTLEWAKVEEAGSYSFTYDCVDGIDVDIVDSEGLRTIACDTTYDLGDTDTVTLIVATQTTTDEEFLDYTIAFTPEDQAESTNFTDESLTIKPNTDDMTDTPDIVAWQDRMAEEPPKTTTVTPTPYLGAPDPEPTSTTPAPKPTPKPATTPVVTKPAYTDLQVLYVGTGTISGNSFSSGGLEQNDEGAVQFTVTNIGTKTSGSWHYSVTLPDGGSYDSPTQTPLAAGEQATISIGFPIDTDREHTFVIIATDSTDRSLANNTVSKNVSIRR